MKGLKDFLKNNISKNKKHDRNEVIEWINKHYTLLGTSKLIVSEEPNSDGFYEVACKDGSVDYNYKESPSLTNGMFIWTIVDGSFSMGWNGNPMLETLEGAPREVGGNFVCKGCVKIKSLKGGPEKVGGDFICNRCDRLESLEGAPKEVKYGFDVKDCIRLESLEGCPSILRGDLNCKNCKSLKSLKGAPSKIIGGSVICSYCSNLKTLEGSPAEVYDFLCNNCTSLKSLKGAPKIVLNNFNCSFCDKLTSIDGMPKEIGRNLYFRDPDVRFSSEELRNASNIKGDVVCYEN